MVKHKAEIMAKPKAEWHSSKKQKQQLKRDSYKDLQNIKDKFDSTKSTNVKEKSKEKKREKKANEKSKFANDFESDRHADRKQKMS